MGELTEKKEARQLAANRDFGKLEKPVEEYPAHEHSANRNLTQERFEFDTGDFFSDSLIERYLRFLASNLSDDGVRAFCHANFAYSQFQKSGTSLHRRWCWQLIDLACRGLAKSKESSKP
jgi:hypothetical protein